MRKAVAITTKDSVLYALCDDGACFKLLRNAWVEVAAIPGTEAASNAVAPTAPASPVTAGKRVKRPLIVHPGL